MQPDPLLRHEQPCFGAGKTTKKEEKSNVAGQSPEEWLDFYQNVLAICDFNMIFIYIVSGWEGTAHDARILNEALDDPIYEFPNSPSDKYYLCDAAYRHTCGFMAPYRISGIHVNENVRDDNDGDFEVAQPIGSEADQQYMINLRDDIPTQIMQARS
ncbi:hypothetical protein Tco_1505329 [Tanacetum coccineum]